MAGDKQNAAVNFGKITVNKRAFDSQTVLQNDEWRILRFGFERPRKIVVAKRFVGQNNDAVEGGKAAEGADFNLRFELGAVVRDDFNFLDRTRTVVNASAHEDNIFVAEFERDG